jgi:hypothetical protein
MRDLSSVIRLDDPQGLKGAVVAPESTLSMATGFVFGTFEIVPRGKGASCLTRDRRGRKRLTKQLIGWLFGWHS